MLLKGLNLCLNFAFPSIFLIFRNVMSSHSKLENDLCLIRAWHDLPLFPRRKKNRMPRKLRRPNEDDFAKHIQLFASDTIFMTTNKTFHKLQLLSSARLPVVTVCLVLFARVWLLLPLHLVHVVLLSNV